MPVNPRHLLDRQLDPEIATGEIPQLVVKQTHHSLSVRLVAPDENRRRFPVIHSQARCLSELSQHCSDTVQVLRCWLDEHRDVVGIKGQSLSGRDAAERVDHPLTSRSTDRLVSVSMAITNSKGEMGSPCRNPLAW